MRMLIMRSLVCLAAVGLAATVAYSDDSEDIKKLVQQEVQRLLATEGVLDAAVEQAIRRFISKQQAQAKAEQLAKVRPVDSSRDHIFGNPDANITLVEYSDFECPFCKRFHPTVVQLMKNNPHNLRWVYRHFPLSFHNPGAQQQAEASECVAELGGNDAFWKYADVIYRETAAGGNGFPLANLRPLAEEIGLNGDEFTQCLESGRMAARVHEDLANGSEAGISGTPAGFLMNQQGEVRFIVGDLPLAQLQSMVDELAH